MLPHQVSKLTKKQKNVLAAAEKKRFCDQRALHIVELLIEPMIDQAWLLHQLQFIDQQHYADVTEERSCTGCCGYPLCANKLGKVPTNQFQISTNTNRIYDISERKKYCSNACFRASRYLKPQIQTSPLWLRDTEPPPVFRLLDEEKNRRGVAGDLVHLGVARAPADEPTQVTTEQVAADMMHQFDELSEQIRDLGLKPGEEPEEEPGEEPGGDGGSVQGSCLRRTGAGPAGRSSESQPPDTQAAVKTVQFAAEVTQDAAAPGQGSRGPSDEAGDVPDRQEERPGTEESAPTPDEPMCRQETPTDDARETRPTPEETSPSRQTQQPAPARPAAPTCGFKRPVRSARRQEHPLKVVEARLLDWMSAQSGAAVSDPLRVEIPADAISTGPDGGPAGTTANVGGSERAAVPATGSGAIPVCSDAGPPAAPESVTSDDTAAGPAAAVSPAEAAARNRALLAYLRGQVRLPPAAPPRPDTRDTRQEPQLGPDGRPVPPEPLLESQDKQRRRIVNEHLSKATARLLPPLGLVMTDVASPLRQMVARFHLTALNVTMGPSQWTLAALTLLRCLLRQSADLSSLARDVSYAFSAALQPYQVTLDRLDRLVDMLPVTASRSAPT